MTTKRSMSFLLAVTGLIGTSSAMAGESDSMIGRRIPAFALQDTNGKQTALADFRDSKLTVVVFLGTQCPIGNGYIPDLNALQEEYGEQGVQVVAVNSNLADTPKAIVEHKQEFKIGFPVLIDTDQVAADLFAAQRTPEAYVLDHRRAVRYHGRIDDRLGYTYRNGGSARADLEEAVKELLADKPVTTPETKPAGCRITRRSSLRERGDITWTSHVAKIVHEKCSNCHHSNTAAPFSLVDFEETRNWSEMIKEVVAERRMPPWSADPRYGKFSNDLRLTKDEVDALVGWIDDGAPFGDKAELPETPEFVDGWTIGKPDLLFEMPESFNVPARGTVAYQYFVTPTNLKKDVWVKAGEPRPGNRSVVHHIIVSYRPEGSNKTDGLPWLAEFAPGEEPVTHPDGYGQLLPAGSELVWQLHYTPNGKDEVDRSELGLVIYDEPPARAVTGGSIANHRFRIPPQAKNHEVVESKTFRRDVQLLTLMPHMHLRGKDFRYTAHFPDGSTKILLDVPDYDFNWQHRYKLESPLFLPRGTRLECVAHFDNSVDNEANPDPTKTVKWGPQSWHEMMIGFYTHIDPKPVVRAATEGGAE